MAEVGFDVPALLALPARKEQVRVADGILGALVDRGIDKVFGIPGGAISPLYDALIDLGLPNNANIDGMSVEGNIMLAMAISGGAAGLAGAIEVSGLTYRLFQQISPGYGFTGIAVALLANNNPIGVIFTGILFGALSSGSEVMQMNARVPSVLVFAIQGIVILSVVAFGAYRLYTDRGE